MTLMVKIQYLITDPRSSQPKIRPQWNLHDRFGTIIEHSDSLFKCSPRVCENDSERRLSIEDYLIATIVAATMPVSLCICPGILRHCSRECLVVGLIIRITFTAIRAVVQKLLQRVESWRHNLLLDFRESPIIKTENRYRMSAEIWDEIDFSTGARSKIQDPAFEIVRMVEFVRQGNCMFERSRFCQELVKPCFTSKNIVEIFDAERVCGILFL